jgi:hypothetical protein
MHGFYRSRGRRQALWNGFRKQSRKLSDVVSEYRTFPLILTAWFDDFGQARFNALRQEHFPARRNLVPAHLTLFHALPGEDVDPVAASLADVVQATPALPFRTDGVLFMGRGAALRISCPGLAAVHGVLRGRWLDELTPQDRQPLRPHVTVQNKVAPDVARRTADMLRGIEPVAGAVEGLILWRYLGGPWDEVARYAFSGGIE